MSGTMRLGTTALRSAVVPNRVFHFTQTAVKLVLYPDPILSILSILLILSYFGN